MSESSSGDSPPESRAGQPSSRDVAAAPTCPHCGSPRLTTAEEPCWNCHTILPNLGNVVPLTSRYAREAKAPLPALNPGLILCGMLYCGAAASAIVFVADFPLAAVLSVVLAVPALGFTLFQFSKRQQLGLPIPVSDVILTFLNYLGILPAAVLFLAMFGCFLACGFNIFRGLIAGLAG